MACKRAPARTSRQVARPWAFHLRDRPFSLSVSRPCSPPARNAAASAGRADAPAGLSRAARRAALHLRAHRAHQRRPDRARRNERAAAPGHRRRDARRAAVQAVCDRGHARPHLRQRHRQPLRAPVRRAARPVPPHRRRRRPGAIDQADRRRCRCGGQPLRRRHRRQGRVRLWPRPPVPAPHRRRQMVLAPDQRHRRSGGHQAVRGGHRRRQLRAPCRARLRCEERRAPDGHRQARQRARRVQPAARHRHRRRWAPVRRRWRQLPRRRLRPRRQVPVCVRQRRQAIRPVRAAEGNRDRPRRQCLCR